jgi:hypothetical protein
VSSSSVRLPAAAPTATAAHLGRRPVRYGNARTAPLPAGSLLFRQHREEEQAKANGAASAWPGGAPARPAVRGAALTLLHRTYTTRIHFLEDSSSRLLRCRSHARARAFNLIESSRQMGIPNNTISISSA